MTIAPRAGAAVMLTLSAIGELAIVSKQRRLAIVGLGMAVTPHAQSLVDLAGRVEVAWAYSPTEARRRSFAARFPFPVTGDFAAIAGDPTIDVVLVLTPPNTHLSIVRELAAAGKHVLARKAPGGLARAAPRQWSRVCAQAGVNLAVVFQHRFRPASLALAARLAAGELGTLANAAVSVRWWRPQTYYDEPGTRHARAGWRRRAADAGDPYAGPVPLAHARRSPKSRRSPGRRRCTSWRPRIASPRRCASTAARWARSTRRRRPIPAFPSGSISAGTKATAVLTPGKLELLSSRRPARDDRRGSRRRRRRRPDGLHARRASGRSRRVPRRARCRTRAGQQRPRRARASTI